VLPELVELQGFLRNCIMGYHSIENRSANDQPFFFVEHLLSEVSVGIYIARRESGSGGGGDTSRSVLRTGHKEGAEACMIQGK